MSTNLIIIREEKSSAEGSSNGLLRFAVSSEPIGDVCLDGLSKYLSLETDNNTLIAAPEEFNLGRRAAKIAYRDNVEFSSELLTKIKRDSWLIVSNGRFATQVDVESLYKMLDGIREEVVAVDVEPGLLGRGEKVRLTEQGNVAGFRRLYADSAQPVPVLVDWPHHIFIKTNVLDRVAPDGTLPQSFSTLMKKCESDKIRFCVINVGGLVLDLETIDGLFSFCQVTLSKIRNSKFKIQNSNVISPDSRIVGKVLLGKNIQIAPGAIVVGPSIISNNVKIGSSAVVNSSIIGPGVCVPANQLVMNRFIKGPKCNFKDLTRQKSRKSKLICCSRFDLNYRRRINDTYRSWPRFSYAGFFKRIADSVAAVIVLVLFAPVLPIIALVIKFTSRGPVFFKDVRQGLHGKVFNCLKFRTMIVGADEIQDKLRGVSQVDGPQFKMEDDPRVNAVGRFLRDTYIDEIPQFFNVLVGQMSVVGPRPSPESENTYCPAWRDARLSVRPGITGLWQVCRTREPMKDFQEWIFYDTKYVRELSLKNDLWICWKTTKKVLRNFFRRF
jgi:lipopolysaccharide/colanic/teichoic acid biosynthesis glycosyltransferase